ncbi:MAG: NAD(P)H-quinone oxidoreductase [Candidatus Manganitrophaceae bacterium]|nr:MAG: NAD(P)H-quinone oxidoreductase [Candidatus Manganitrophaceae bacterium]
MKAIEIEQFGGPEVLKVGERPRPMPGPQEVLIEVHAAGVNRPDCYQRQGHYPSPPGASDILGLEVSGTIAALGSEATRWTVGARVCALVSGGGYAEYVAAPEGQCLPIPSRFDFVQAAALPETFFTVWTNLFESGRLQKGETALIHGGSGGIGTTAIQMAHARGARVFTTVGKEASVSVCKSLGAERVILYREEDFVSVVKALTQGRGADVILDMVGGPYFPRNLEALALKGRLVQIATIQGATVDLDLRKILFKRLLLTGSTLRARPAEEKAAIAQALEKQIWPLLNEGKIKPVIDRTFPLERAREAHERMESGDLIGKIVLTVK